MSEVSSIYQKYFNDKSYIINFYGNQENSIMNLIPFLQSINEFEAPDAFSVIDDKALIIEHFEFDSSYSGKKGSLSKSEKVNIERNFIKEVKKANLKIGETFKKCAILKTSRSVENYIKNVLNNFNNHYQKIDKYKSNLLEQGKIKKSTQVKTMFWIEDTSILGNFFESDDTNFNTEVVPLIPLHCDKFLDRLKECDKLDYIFCFSCYRMQKYIWFLDLNYINEQIKNQLIVSDIELFNSKPFQLSYQTLLKIGDENQ